MKSRKILLFISLLIPSLMSCNTNKTDSLKIISPSGAPSLAFYKYSLDNNFETNSNPENISKMLVNDLYDVVVLPTNIGVSAITKNSVNYKIAATITFGNLFIGSTGNDLNGIMDPGDSIVSFQQGGLPDKIFHYVYGNEFDNSIYYHGNAQEAAICLKKGIDLQNNNKKVDYVLLAEPALYSVVSTTENRTVYSNLQELYRQKSGGLKLFQASIFISNKVDKNKADSFLEKIKNDINDSLLNPELIENELNKNAMSENIYGVKPNVARAVTENSNGMGLGFELAKNNKDAIDLFMNVLGLEKTDEKIYY